MSQPTLPPPYRLDDDDPRAPTVEQWAILSEAERDAVVDALPSEFAIDEAHPPERQRSEQRLLEALAEIERLKRGQEGREP